MPYSFLQFKLKVFCHVIDEHLQELDNVTHKMNFILMHFFALFTQYLIELTIFDLHGLTRKDVGMELISIKLSPAWADELFE